MNIKEKIAKGMCLTTIMLLLFNVVFSLSGFSSVNQSKVKDHQLKITKLIETADAFVLEKEETEELEDFKDFLAYTSEFSYGIISLIKEPRFDLSYSNYHYSIITLAKWLAVRHILI